MQQWKKYKISNYKFEFSDKNEVAIKYKDDYNLIKLVNTKIGRLLINHDLLIKEFINIIKELNNR